MTNKRASDMWVEPEEVTISSGATVTAILNSGATVTQSGGLPAGTSYIGLATVDVGANVAWSDPGTYVGLATVDIGSQPSLPAGTNTIGDVRIAGSKSAPTTATIGLYNSGNATVFVATNTFKILNMMIGVDLAEEIKVLSGTDYLVGNASVALSLAAEGGFVQNGSPDSPLYVATAAAKGFVINSSATGAIGGSVTWIDEA